VVSSGQLLAFAAASFVLIVIPGPSVLFIVGRALAHGRRVALATVVGNAAGIYVVAALVAFGIGSVVARSDAMFAVVKFAGAVYLIWLGLNAIRHRRDLDSVLAADAALHGQRRAMRDGFVVGLANPKAVILFAAILPQFVDRSAGHVPEQMLVLAVVSSVIALISDSGWALAAATVRAWFARSPRRLQLVGGAGGLAMIALGLAVAITGRND
jgi:threonine/homoserine/homoserine lactone efflux protein